MNDANGKPKPKRPLSITIISILGVVLGVVFCFFGAFPGGPALILCAIGLFFMNRWTIRLLQGASWLHFGVICIALLQFVSANNFQSFNDSQSYRFNYNTAAQAGLWIFWLVLMGWLYHFLISNAAINTILNHQPTDFKIRAPMGLEDKWSKIFWQSLLNVLLVCATMSAVF